MQCDNTVFCYNGLNRIYRNSIVSHIRQALTKEYGAETLEGIIKSPFKDDEWEKIKSNAYMLRQVGLTDWVIKDSVDLLSVNHFFNIFDKYYDLLVEAEKLSRKRPEYTKRKQNILAWIKEIKDIRDPLSHPSEMDIPKEDAYRLLDCARRVLMQIGCNDAANSIKELMTELMLGSYPLKEDKEPLEDKLPPRESIVVGFVGRAKELDELRQWFSDPVARRWALAGDGGKGKTALAYQFAFDVKVSGPAPFVLVLWLSAKKRKFFEGEIVPVDRSDFSDLDSALNALLMQMGWIDCMNDTFETKRVRVLELLNAFPALIVVDDVDSVESEGEDAIEFFSLQVPETRSKVLFTSRRVIFGMGKATTTVKGFSEIEGRNFILSRCKLLELDPKAFDDGKIKHILEATEGSPLYIEDLMRLSAVVNSLDDAVKLWEAKRGHEARKYALGREIDLLTPDAKKVLVSACVANDEISFSDIEAITSLPSYKVTNALQELQRLFLVPKPMLIRGNNLFRVNINTRKLVRELMASDDSYRRSKQAYDAIRRGIPAFQKGNIGAIITQAIVLSRSGRGNESEALLKEAIGKFVNPDLYSVLGVVYKIATPPRITDAREAFFRAYQLNCTSEDTYTHWFQMERKSEEWKRAAEAAEKGIERVGKSKRLFYYAGYARARLAGEFRRTLHSEKAEDQVSDALKHFRNAQKAPPLDSAFADNEINCGIFRGLVLCAEIKDDPRAMKKNFAEWRKSCPGDPNIDTEYERLASRYDLTND
jgi:tetratricopeptide (TPR) repeat protein